jgi:hypothetical protein
METRRLHGGVVRRDEIINDSRNYDGRVHTLFATRKSFNTALTPAGALYFHELIVEARNSAFCGTRVA